MAWINVVSFDESEGDLRATYEELGLTSGSMFPPYEVMTNTGPVLLQLQRFDTAVRFQAAELGRARVEMIAALVSSLNGCVF